MYENSLGDLGLSELPMQRLPRIRSLDRVLTTQAPSEWMVETITSQWKDRGFRVVCQDTRYDPVLGHVSEWWGYSK